MNEQKTGVSHVRTEGRQKTFSKFIQDEKTLFYHYYLYYLFLLILEMGNYVLEEVSLQRL